MVRRNNHIVEPQHNTKKFLLFLDDNPLLTLFTIGSQAFFTFGISTNRKVQYINEMSPILQFNNMIVFYKP